MCDRASDDRSGTEFCSVPSNVYDAVYYGYVPVKRHFYDAGTYCSSMSAGMDVYAETKDKIITAISGIVPIAAVIGVYVWKPELYDNGMANIISCSP